jgi:Fe-S-cluster containining protein
MPQPAHSEADQERLGRLVTQLDSDPRYATGSRRFPGHVSTADAVAMAAALADEFDGGVEARARQAEKQGLNIACDIGCDRCCRIVVSAYAPEVMRVVEFLNQPEHAGERAGFLARYPAWRETVGDGVSALPSLSGQAKGAEFEATHLALWRKGASCAFNEGGVCTIYPVRPLACRNAHALDTDTHCVPDPPGGKPPASVDFVPLSRFLTKASRLLHAAHNAVTAPAQRHQQEALCLAVHRDLGRGAGAQTPG